MKRFPRLLFCFALITALVQVAHAQVTIYTAILNGANEAPANASPATGLAIVTLNFGAPHIMRVQVTFAGLVANVTAAHIHAATASPGTGTAGVATTTPTFTDFPTAVTGGTYVHDFNMTFSSSYNASFITNNGATTASAETALFTAIANGRAYLNIQSATFPGGEIRGFLTPIPEPSTYAGLAGLAALVFAIRRRVTKLAAAT